MGGARSVRGRSVFLDDQRLEQLELKLAYLERGSQELGDVVYRQQQEIEALRDRLERLTDQVRAAADQGRELIDPDEKPPHY
jgi:SlyX protein